MQYGTKYTINTHTSGTKGERFYELIDKKYCNTSFYPICKDEDYKWSKYNSIKTINNNKQVLFNCSTNKYIFIDENIKKNII